MFHPADLRFGNMRFGHLLVWAALTAEVLFSASCDSDDSETPAKTSTETTDAGSHDSGYASESKPKPAAGSGAEKDKPDTKANDKLFLIATTHITGDDVETYLVTSPTFDESTKIDPTNGPKLLGGITPVITLGQVYVPDSNGPVILRYKVDEQNKLVKSGEISFAAVGVSKISSAHIYAVSETKAYLFDPPSLRIIVWNPSTMKLAGKEIDLKQLAADKWSTNVNLELMGPQRRGDQLLAPVSWQDQDGNSRFASGVVALDLEADAVISSDVDERCGESMTSLKAPNGDIYFLPPAWTSTTHFYTDKHQPTCAPRIPAGETNFDDAEPWDLSAIGSGGAVAGGIPDGETGFIFASIDAELWANRESDLEGFWRLWHYDFETKESRLFESLPPWIGQAYYAYVDGKYHIIYWEETSTGHRTTLWRVNGSNDPSKLFAFEASWYGFGQLK